MQRLDRLDVAPIGKTKGKRFVSLVAEHGPTKRPKRWFDSITYLWSEKMNCSANVYWIIPILLTVVVICMLIRPYTPSAMFDVGPLERVLWVIPILATWLAFFVGLWLAR